MNDYLKFFDSFDVRDTLSERYGKTLTATDLLPEDRPREKLVDGGCSALSDRELLAVIVGSGVRGKNVFDVSENLLEKINKSNGAPSVKELSELDGLGLAKACTIVAMLEFGRRRWGLRGVRVRGASDLYEQLRHYAISKQEQFFAISLNGAHEILGIRMITVGLVNKTIVHPREVFADAIADRASAIVIAHNHPSGQVKPSPEDDEITEKLVKAGRLLGVQVLDHVIFTRSGYFSYSAEKRLPKHKNSDAMDISL
jgi:DNA repair protein RadC